MGQDNIGDPDDVASEHSSGEHADWSRRNLLKISGAGIGLAALGGAALASENNAGPAEDSIAQTETPTSTPEPGSTALVDDLIDPTFGYPLAADETDGIDIEPVVDLVSEQGEGAHANFPVDSESGEVIPAEFFFDPVGIQIRPDTVVQFVVDSGEHTVTAFHEKFSLSQRPIPTRVPGDIPGFTSPPVVDGESWLYQFTTKGVYDILCLPHMGLGMVMRVVVFDPDEDDIESDTFAVPAVEDLPSNTAAVLTAPELDPANIVDTGTVPWADLTLGQQETETPTETPTETATPGAVAWSVRIEYAGSWDLILRVNDSQQDVIQDNGNRTIDIDEENVETISATAEKNESDDQTLRVAIRKNDEVVAESSTDAPNGEVHVSHSEE